ncbi:hypothetical protein [Tropicimonas sediminicola]|nr:hypothetical protein [Tropicimonas sediminicola]
MMRRFGWLLGLLLGTAATAGDVEIADYRVLRDDLDGRIDFERLPPRAEPGFNLDRPVYSSGAWIGERFVGQQVSSNSTGHDTITGAPDGPWLRIAGGAPRQNLSVASHRGFGSNALFPLGPAGFPALEARGEGAVAILFDTDQPATGFRVHTDYAAPLGTGPAAQGSVEVTLLARDGQRLGHFSHHPGTGITELGYRLQGAGPGIAGMLILNTDPGGIAIDDILFAKPRPLG